jgi:hypothetical protein
MGAGVAASNVNQGQGIRSAPSPWRVHAMTIERYGNTRYWAVYASDGILICVCVYRKGAQEVVRQLTGQEPAHT